METVFLGCTFSAVLVIPPKNQRRRLFDDFLLAWEFAQRRPDADARTQKIFLAALTAIHAASVDRRASLK